MTDRTVLIDVDSWGASTVWLVQGRTKLRLTSFSSTAPSGDYLRSARRFARTFKRVTGVEHVRIVNPHGW